MFTRIFQISPVVGLLALVLTLHSAAAGAGGLDADQPTIAAKRTKTNQLSSPTVAKPVGTKNYSLTTMDGQQVKPRVFVSGGGSGNSASYRSDATIGQAVVGSGSSTSYRVAHGVRQDFKEPYLCGDADASGSVDIDDVVYLIEYIFRGGPPPIPYEAGDADCSGAVDIDDVVYLIDYIFGGGPAPCDPNGDGIPDC